jgi:hypothetical protein
MECACEKTKTGKDKAYSQKKVNEIFRSILKFVEKAPEGPGEAMHLEAPTKGDLDAFAAKILAAVAIETRVSPPTSQAESFVEATSNVSPPQSIPQSVLTRMTTSPATAISLRKYREIRVKRNFNNDNRPRAGHSRTSTEIVKVANAGIERAGLLQGPPGSRTIEMATVQVSGDYLLILSGPSLALIVFCLIPQGTILVMRSP